MLADPGNRAIAMTSRADRAARIARNALALGAPSLTVVTGKAPHALTDLPEPDAIFVGGGATAPGLIDRVVDALRPGAARGQRGHTGDAGGRRRVALLLGGELAQVAVAHAEPVGRFLGWRAAMPVVQWRWTKP